MGCDFKMVKKIFSMIVFVLLMMISVITLAQTKTVYYTPDEINIVTKIKTQTIIFFRVEIEFASVGNLNYFKVDRDSKLDKLILTPLQTGVNTNLIVVTKDSLKYTFRLFEDDKHQYNDIVDVLPILSVSPDEYVNAMIAPFSEIDPAKKPFFKIYSVNDKQYDFQTPTSIGIEVKKVLQIENTEKTIIWIKLSNNSTDKKTNSTSDIKTESSSEILPVNSSPNTIYIPINSMKIKERDLQEIVIENNREKLKPGESVNVFLKVDGIYLDNSITFLFTINSKEYNYLISDIPYKKQEFKTFNIENKSYDNFILNNYL